MIRVFILHLQIFSITDTAIIIDYSKFLGDTFHFRGQEQLQYLSLTTDFIH
jgi:hypothetical protein